MSIDGYQAPSENHTMHTCIYIHDLVLEKYVERTCLDKCLENQPFSEKEIEDAIMGSYSCGAPGPDGFSFLFYQKKLPIIRKDFMVLVGKFEA
jgi:hypothetical protein